MLGVSSTCRYGQPVLATLTRCSALVTCTLSMASVSFAQALLACCYQGPCQPGSICVQLGQERSSPLVRPQLHMLACVGLQWGTVNWPLPSSLVPADRLGIGSQGVRSSSALVRAKQHCHDPSARSCFQTRRAAARPGQPLCPLCTCHRHLYNLCTTRDDTPDLLPA